MTTLETSEKPPSPPKSSIQLITATSFGLIALSSAIFGGVFALGTGIAQISLSALIFLLMAMVWILAQQTGSSPLEQIGEAIMKMFGLGKEESDHAAEEYAKKKAVLVSAVKYLTDGRNVVSLKEDIDLAIEVVRCISRIEAGKGLQAYYNERVISFGKNLDLAQKEALDLRLRLQSTEKKQLDQDQQLKMMQKKIEELAFEQKPNGKNNVLQNETSISASHPVDVASLKRRIENIERMLLGPDVLGELKMKVTRRGVKDLHYLKTLITELEEKSTNNHIDIISRSDWLSEGIITQEKKFRALQNMVMLQSRVLKSLASEKDMSLLESITEEYNRVMSSTYSLLVDSNQR